MKNKADDDGAISGLATKEIRLALGLSQEAWAKRLGVKRVATISRWENGHRAPNEHFHRRIRNAAAEVGVEL
uniref:Putative DNA binding, helix-turn-helix domain containing protein n=1 Tax=viral metagenome TaxID=1070528 RepID=A0A6M3J119_9ZZZZ